MGRERIVEIEIDSSYMEILLDQGDMSEDEFYEYAVDYVLRNINIEVS